MRRVCDDILKVKPDLVITEKGVSVRTSQLAEPLGPMVFFVEKKLQQLQKEP